MSLGVDQVGLVLRLLGERLIEGRLKGPRIDLHEEIALLDHLALLEADLDDLTVNAAADGHGVKRLHRPETVQIDRKSVSFARATVTGIGGGPPLVTLLISKPTAASAGLLFTR